jgi:regulator of sigma E protease
MLAFLAPVLVFGLVIFVHEFGHFLAAKALGVYAPRFSIGFGPALFRIRRGETEYVLALFPLGGYVRMASRLDEETAFLEGGSEQGAAATHGGDPDAMIPFGPKPVPEDRWFESKPLIARIAIMVAGVTMNALLALVVCISITFHEGRELLPTTAVMSVTPIAQLPELAQLQPGDTIRAVNGTPVGSWNDVEETIGKSTTTADLQTQHGLISLPLAKNGITGATLAAALEPYIPPVIDSVVPGDPASVAGFQKGDSVVAIGGVPVRTWVDLTTAIGASARKPMQVDVLRRDGLHTLTVTPKAVSRTDSATGKSIEVGQIGATDKVTIRHEPVSVGRAVVNGSRMTMLLAGTVVGFLRDLFVGQVSLKQLGGPIAITRASVSAAQSGMVELFYLIALLSINVAILNLLPVPILDGGQILINVLESAKGSPFSLRTREYILRFGLAVIALLFMVVMYNDTREWFIRLFGWGAKLFA